eukprot:jgi/Bigna1/54240/estExt_Genewise1Plus.C_300120
MASMEVGRYADLKTIRVSTPSPFVKLVEINRPKKLNAMNRLFWKECRECFTRLGSDKDVRTIVLSATGRVFTAGIDLKDHMSLFQSDMDEDQDIARMAYSKRETIENYQESFTSIERCPKPVICAVHGACVGAGVDMITAGDIRLCSQNAFFTVKEVDVGLAADVGTLQRLPKVVRSESLVRELCFTARKMFAAEAKECGLVSRVFPDKKAMMANALGMAKLIASKSPVAVQGTKMALVHARDHSVKEGLDFIKNWNMSMLLSEDIAKSFAGKLAKKTPIFSKL